MSIRHLLVFMTPNVLKVQGWKCFENGAQDVADKVPLWARNVDGMNILEATFDACQNRDNVRFWLL